MVCAICGQSGRHASETSSSRTAEQPAGGVHCADQVDAATLLADHLQPRDGGVRGAQQAHDHGIGDREVVAVRAPGRRDHGDASGRARWSWSSGCSPRSVVAPAPGRARRGPGRRASAWCCTLSPSGSDPVGNARARCPTSGRAFDRLSTGAGRASANCHTSMSTRGTSAQRQSGMARQRRAEPTWEEFGREIGRPAPAARENDAGSARSGPLTWPASRRTPTRSSRRASRGRGHRSTHVCPRLLALCRVLGAAARGPGARTRRRPRRSSTEPDSPRPDRMTYTHGHAESVLRSHRTRTAENSAAYLLPHLRAHRPAARRRLGPGHDHRRPRPTGAARSSPSRSTTRRRA